MGTKALLLYKALSQTCDARLWCICQNSIMRGMVLLVRLLLPCRDSQPTVA
jgi:hypothetical protein